MYTHDECVAEIYGALGEVVDGDVHRGPFKMYALEADECTDTANCSVLIVYIRYVGSDGKVHSRFLSVAELESTTADAIYATLKNIIKSKVLNENCLVGLTTDGASAMMGVHRGATTGSASPCDTTLYGPQVTVGV